MDYPETGRTKRWILFRRGVAMSGNSSHHSGGIGCAGVLQIVFIVLKLTNLISWSWWWVLSPTLISIALVLLLIALAVIVALADRD
jgi:hypothetical protein